MKITLVQFLSKKGLFHGLIPGGDEMHLGYIAMPELLSKQCVKMVFVFVVQIRVIFCEVMKI